MSRRIVNHPFPDIIRRLPEAKIALQGVRAWISQGEDHQVVFFEIEPATKIPDHFHGAQWGMVVDGEMELTIEGITTTCEKGCFYYIPDGAVHSAVFKAKTFALDFFADRDRYQTNS
jgi:quercetin dioxygenase-like cupin family protein